MNGLIILKFKHSFINVIVIYRTGGKYFNLRNTKSEITALLLNHFSKDTRLSNKTEAVIKTCPGN